MKKIKVLHMGLSDNVGGIETVVHSWHNFLPDDINFDFINVGKNKLAFEDDFVKKGSSVYRIPSRKENPLRFCKELKKILAENDYTYLHFHAMSLSFPEPALLAAKSGKTIPIVHSHMVNNPNLSNLSAKYRMLHLMGKERLKHIDFLRLACGEQAGLSMFQCDDFKVIYNGIELGLFDFNSIRRINIRSKYGINESTFLIGHVGRPGPQKNYPFLLRTFNELLKTGIDCKLMLIGNLQGDKEINRIIMELGIKEHVIFTGYIKDCAPYYDAMDCFFFPSIQEGFSVSLVEAQMSGLPCVVSESIAKESKLSDDFVFVNLNSTNQAVQALLKFRNQARKSVDERILYRFDIHHTAENLFSFYREHIPLETE